MTGCRPEVEQCKQQDQHSANGQGLHCKLVYNKRFIQFVLQFEGKHVLLLAVQGLSPCSTGATLPLRSLIQAFLLLLILKRPGLLCLLRAE